MATYPGPGPASLLVPRWSEFTHLTQEDLKELCDGMIDFDMSGPTLSEVSHLVNPLTRH